MDIVNVNIHSDALERSRRQVRLAESSSYLVNII